MSDSGKAVFLSYASQDAEAAKKICEALRAAGVEVWFDQSELVGGDAWDAKIRGQISSCALFVPIISANTQARREGYFRLEWKLAAQRTMTIADGEPFLLPAVIDDTGDASAKVPAEFKAVQWTRLPGGETSPAFVGRVKGLLEGEAAGVATVAEKSSGSQRQAAPLEVRPRGRLAWTVGVVAALVIAGALGSKYLRRDPRPPGAAPSVAVASPAMRALQLRALTGLSRDRLGAAEELLAQALKADPTDATALALSAQVDALMVYRSWDATDERRQSAAKHSARALALAPEAFESRRAQAMVASFMVRSPESLKEGEAIYRSLAAERTADPNVLEELGTVLQMQRQHNEAAEIFVQAGRTLRAGNAYYAGGRIEEARRVADGLLAEKRTAEALILKANVELFGYNDRAAAQAAVDQLTPTELREDDAAGIALRLAVLSRDAPGILRLLEPFPHPFVSILGVNYPRQYWTGLARSLLNQPEAAMIEWRGGLRSVEDRLRAQPSDTSTISWAAMFHAALGQRAEMEQALRTYANYRDLTTGRWDFNYCVPMIRLGERRDEVLARLSKSLHDTANFNRILYAWARYSPEFDPVRGDPRFERLLRETRPPDAMPFEDEATAASVPAVDGKSIAVLAFANLSDDKGNEYFSDGISEELLNVLAKVPGLKVSARTSAFYFKGKEVPIPEIAKQLGVAYVVEGSVRKQGEKVRITAQLIKAADGFHVWSDTFTRDLKDIFAVQDEIAGLVAQQLQLKLEGSSRATIQVNPEAYRLVLEGRYFWSLRTEDGFRRAEAAFRRALEHDPQFAQAHAGLADVWSIRGWYHLLSGISLEPKDFAPAIAAAERAIQLDPQLAEPHTALGAIYFNQGKLAEATRQFETALRLNPGYSFAHHWWSHVLIAEGRLGEGLREIDTALRLDPLSFITITTACSYYTVVGRYAEALALNDRALALRADLFPPAVGERAFLLWKLGRRDEAVAAARLVGRNVTIQPRWWQDAEAIQVLREAGFADEAVVYAERFLATLPSDSHLRSFVAIGLGRKDEALELLAKNGSYSSARAAILYSTFWDEVRDDPRFVRTLEVLDLARQYPLARSALASQKIP